MSEPLPGRPIDVPVPPELAEALGYRGPARYVGFHFIQDADDLVLDDGQTSGNAATHVFHLYCRHMAVGGLLDDAGIGLRENPPTHWLILDRTAGRASLVPVEQARRFLEAQWSRFRQEQIDAIHSWWQSTPEPDWREEHVADEVFRRAVEEQRGRVGRLISWLDQCPAAPRRGRGD